MKKIFIFFLFWIFLTSCFGNLEKTNTEWDTSQEVSVQNTQEVFTWTIHEESLVTDNTDGSPMIVADDDKNQDQSDIQTATTTENNDF